MDSYPMIAQCIQFQRKGVGLPSLTDAHVDLYCQSEMDDPTSIHYVVSRKDDLAYLARVLDTYGDL